MKGYWIIKIREYDNMLEAEIENGLTDKKRSFTQPIDGPDDRNRAIAELFAGPRPNIRDSFDTV